MEPFEQPGRLQGTIWTVWEATGKHVDSPAGARYLYGQPRRLQGARSSGGPLRRPGRLQGPVAEDEPGMAPLICQGQI